MSHCTRVALAVLVACVGSTVAHGDHIPEQGETMSQYAARHMASEHHIDSFDPSSFFKLHDLNRNGFWEREEIEAIYGVHHVYSQKQSKDDEEHQKKADIIVNAILDRMDTDKDGRVSLAECIAKGLDSLPTFAHLGAEGHHYDVESEFFLHHEELYHSTPETQTDESYTHAEDIEHFAQHEAIEAEELERERIFQGLPQDEESSIVVEEEAKQTAEPFQSDQNSPNDTQSDSALDDLEGHQAGGSDMSNHDHDDQKILKQPSLAPKPKFTRVDPPEAKDPSEKYAEARKEGQDKPEWGQGSDGYKRPKTAADKMRRNVPYKYKFRRNWGDF